jgi:tetratricopeptide (TPR) repeat protein
MLRAIRLVVLVPLAGLLLGLCFLSWGWSAKGAEGAVPSDPRRVHPARELRLAMGRVRSGTDPDDPALITKVRAALQRAPLEEEPFIVAGLAHFNAGDYTGAQKAVAVARRRNPRSREALFLSADVALARGDIRGAVESLEVLLRIFPRQGQVAREALNLLTSDPEAGKVALAALSDDPIKSDALTALARSGAGSSRLLEAIQLMQTAEGLVTNPGMVNAIVRPLVEASDVAGAYRVWSALLQEPPAPGVTIRDPQFAGSLPPPFGWDIQTSSDGYAETGPDGLIGDVYGRRSVQLARQLLMLPAGSYRLEIDAAVPSDQLDAIIICLPAMEIARTAVAQERTVSSTFTIPAACAGQWLELKARASDPPRAGAFHIRAIRIVKVVS